MVDLVFVHGRNQQRKDPLKLRDNWTTGLRRGLAKAKHSDATLPAAAFPFYGDLLASLVKSSGGVGHGAGGDALYDEFRAEVLNEMAGRANVDVGALEAGAIAHGTLDHEWLQKLGGGIAKKVPWLQERSIDAFTRDVWMYLTDPVIREQVDELVAAKIPAGPCAVVSHSLGTVVAYNVLAKRPGLNVALFVTAGSPLGLKAIRDRCERPLGNPACTQAWLNATDRDDVVALEEKLDRETFSPTANIDNRTDIDNKGQPHSIERYLADEVVAGRIGKALGLPAR